MVKSFKGVQVWSGEGREAKLVHYSRVVPQNEREARILMRVAALAWRLCARRIGYPSTGGTWRLLAVKLLPDAPHILLPFEALYHRGRAIGFRDLAVSLRPALPPQMELDIPVNSLAVEQATTAKRAPIVTAARVSYGIYVKSETAESTNPGAASPSTPPVPQRAESLMMPQG